MPNSTWENLEGSQGSPRLTRSLSGLADLVCQAKSLSLGTIGMAGFPEVSMCPYIPAWLDGPCLAIHVSLLASHARNMSANPNAGAMIVGGEHGRESVLDMPRASFSTKALDWPSEHWNRLSRDFIARHPQSEQTMELGDFRFVALKINATRYIEGFGMARTLALEDLELVWRTLLNEPRFLPG